jgi:hypothetical protein
MYLNQPVFHVRTHMQRMNCKQSNHMQHTQNPPYYRPAHHIGNRQNLDVVCEWTVIDDLRLVCLT